MTVGRRTRSIEWDARTSGASRYVADVVLPGTLVARVLRSPHPHARIMSIDAEAARRMPGVRAVLTAADLPDRLYKHEGGRLSDRRPLARDVVRFVGEEVAVAAAETAEQAAAALAVIQVRYESLPAVTTVEAALAKGAARVHERASGTNVSLAINRAYGDVDGGRRAATVTASGRYRFGRQAHACMEPNGSLARWDPEARRLELWTSTQSPYFVREEVAQILGLELGQVIVREVAVGGGFGSKSKVTDHEVLAGALAIRTGRPVRLVLSREEEFATTKCRHDVDVELTTGADADGRLTHREARMLVDNGAYNHSGASVTGASVAAMASWYRTRGGVHVRATLVDTNKHPGGQFRGYGHPQVAFAIESQMDELADACGLDPIEFRILNAHRPGDVTQAGWRLRSTHLVECLEAVRDAIGWREKRARGGSGRGVGVAVAMHVSGARTYEAANRSEAAIDIRPDGEVRVRFGGADPGTGQKTVIAQVAAQELGVDLSRITVITMDSEVTPFDLGSWSSRGTVMSAHAAGTAARTAGRRLRELAADKLGVPAEDVSLQDGHAVAGHVRIAIEDLVTGLGDGLSVTEAAVVDTELVNHATGIADISPAYSFAAHAVEVEVDRATGEVRVLDVVAAHDCGAAINPTAVESQIVGGVVMGLGAALGEQLLYEGGRLVNPAYLHYALPRAADVPPVRAIAIGRADPHAPYGVKGVGEISMVPVAPAVANAVAHAVGVRVRELPITPDKVLGALRARDGGGRRRYHLWRRPGRWWIGSMRWAYPRGIHALLDRRGTRSVGGPPPTAITDLERPTAVSGVVDALRRHRDATPVAGGTDLLPLIEQGLQRPRRLVDLGGVAEVAQIRETDSGDLVVGAGVTLADLGRWPRVDPLIRRVVASIASAQIREMATVGGNLCQAKRCWFYRNGFACYKRSGVTAPCYAVLGDNRYYHAVLGGHRCQAVTPSDLGTALVALDATIRTAGPGGPRTLPLARFYAGPGETALRSGEIVVAVHVPASARARVSRFEKLRLWEGDFAVVSACASLDLADGVVRDARVVLGAVAPTPYRARAVERRLRGRRLTPDTIAAAADAWVGAAHPLTGNEWKVDAACGLLRRCLDACRASHGA
jgi:CO/xanthine dehydrogenase Mo-binding subunit/CO/xanthine dehydrogenase FAD-binding subunit